MGYRRLSSKEIEQRARSIHPGSWAIDTRQPLATLLGSCVSVCLFDPLSKIGGLNHFMLPSIGCRSMGSADSLLGGDRAMATLLDALLQRGAKRAQLQAKAFGGGRIFDPHGPEMDIGLRNATFAKEWLRGEGIPLSASDLLGPWSRKILFLPHTGDALCRRMVTTMATAAVIEREEATYARLLHDVPGASQSCIELA